MKIRLGYACISNIINISSSSTITLTYYKKLNNEIQLNKIDDIINNNLDNLEKIIIHNIKNNIHFFRITAKLIPLVDLIEIDLNKYKNRFEKIGDIINKNNMRISVHADEYCVLNSINETVVFKSIKIIGNLNTIMNMFNIKYNIILHIGSKTNGIKESIKRFKNNFNLLDNDIKNKIILENDDKNFNTYQTLKLCEDLHIPMCLDIHHHNCNKCTKNITEYLERIYNTYPKNIIPKMHYSTPKNKKEKRSHNNFINTNEFIIFLNLLKKYNTDTDIMIEAKEKDLSLIKLSMELRYITNYKFIDNSTFIVK